MQNKIPHSKLLSPTMLENGICWGYHFESRVIKIFTDVYWDCWEVSFSYFLVCNCLFRIVYNHLFNDIEWVTHYNNTKKQGVHLTYTQPSPLTPSEYGPSSTYGSPCRCAGYRGVGWVYISSRVQSPTASGHKSFSEGWTVLVDNVNKFPSWFELGWTAGWVSITLEDTSVI